MPPIPPAPAQAVANKWWELLRIQNYLAIVAGVACISIAGYSLSTFAPPAYLMRVRGMSLSEVGVQYGIASGAIGVLGLLVVGRLADMLSSKDKRWLLWLVIAVIVVALPFSILGFIVTQPGGLAVFFHRDELHRGSRLYGAVRSGHSATGSDRAACHRVRNLPFRGRHHRRIRTLPDRSHQ